MLLLAERAYGGDDRLDHLFDVELFRVELHLAGLHLRQVEYVVDELKQMLAGTVDLLQVGDDRRLVELLGLLLEHLAVPDDGVERGAQLVAHVGEECALRLIRAFGDRPCLLRHDRRLCELSRALRHPVLKLLIDLHTLDGRGDFASDRQEQRLVGIGKEAARAGVVDAEDPEPATLGHERRQHDLTRLEHGGQVGIMEREVADDHRLAGVQGADEGRSLLGDRDLQHGQARLLPVRSPGAVPPGEGRALVVEQHGEGAVDMQIVDDGAQAGVEQIVEVKGGVQRLGDLVQRRELGHAAAELEVGELQLGLRGRCGRTRPQTGRAVRAACRRDGYVRSGAPNSGSRTIPSQRAAPASPTRPRWSRRVQEHHDADQKGEAHSPCDPWAGGAKLARRLPGKLPLAVLGAIGLAADLADPSGWQAENDPGRRGERSLVGLTSVADIGEAMLRRYLGDLFGAVPAEARRARGRLHDSQDGVDVGSDYARYDGVGTLDAERSHEKNHHRG